MRSWGAPLASQRPLTRQRLGAEHLAIRVTFELPRPSQCCDPSSVSHSSFSLKPVMSSSLLTDTIFTALKIYGPYFGGTCREEGLQYAIDATDLRMRIISPLKTRVPQNNSSAFCGF